MKMNKYEFSENIKNRDKVLEKFSFEPKHSAQRFLSRACHCIL